MTDKTKPDANGWYRAPSGAGYLKPGAFSGLKPSAKATAKPERMADVLYGEHRSKPDTK